MFGIWRTLLALEVAAFHLLLLPFIGNYAVFSFFVLSGFLMTAIMHGTYGYSPGGFARYLGNRALRLYPSYWFALVITIALIWIFGAGRVSGNNPIMALPASATSWAENLSIIFPSITPRDVAPRLVPLAWALTVEISYYVLIGLGISRNRTISWLWLIASIAYAAAARSLHHPRDVVDEIIPHYLYSAIPAGSLPFASGALAWHYRDELHRLLTRWKAQDPRLLIVSRWTFYLAMVAVLSLARWAPLVMIGNYFNIVLSALIVCTLFHSRPNTRLRVLDKAVGDFSYPIYLLHLQMGLVVAWLLFGHAVAVRSPQSLAIFALGLVLTVILAAICARLLDPAVEKLRRRIKQA